jgi:CHAT domain-containing protein/Tfp pilus assembly protein PilF
MRPIALVGTLLGALLALPLLSEPPGAAEPPAPLTAERRKELEAKARALNEAGDKAYRENRLDEAVKAFTECLAMLKRLHTGDHSDVAVILNNLAVLLSAQGKASEAEPFDRDALAMRRRLFKGDHRAVAQSLDNLGALLTAQGKAAEAEPYLRDALAMRQRLYQGDHPYVAESLNNVGSLLQHQGKAAEAEPYLREALAMRQRLFKGDHPDVANSLYNLGSGLRNQRKAAEAEPFARDALAMKKRLFTGDHPDVARSLDNLGLLLRDQGKAAEAEPFARDALAMRQRLHRGDHPDVATSLNNLGVLLSAQGKAAEAEPYYRDALAMRRRLFKGDHRAVAESLNNVGSLLQAQGKAAEAEPYHREALAMWRRLAVAYAGLKGEGDALTLAAAQPLARDTYLSLALHRKADAAEVYGEVWASRAALSRVYERRALAARAAAADPQAAALLARLTDARRRRADLLLAPQARDAKAQEKRQEEVAALGRQIDDLGAQLRPLLPALQRWERLAPATPADLQKVLSPDAVLVDLLAYTRFEIDLRKPGDAGWKRTPGYLAFVVSRGGVQWADLGEAAAIERAVALWREALATPRAPVPADLPAKVRQLVWAKVRSLFPPGTRVVYVAPDLALARVPWAALPGDRPGTLVLEEFAVATVPHGPFLLDRLSPQPARPTGRDRLLVVGGVSYGDEPRSVSDTALADLRRGEPLTVPGQKLTWAELPGAAREAKAVAALADRRKLNADTLTGADASAARVLAELPKARYAHLATHGFFADPSFRSVLQLDPSLFEMRGSERVGAGALSPMVLSGLVFAGANRPGTPGRGLVTGEHLVDRDLSGLELAVLSACETGLGDVAGGEGVFGLQRAFHLAGCRDVVATLWKVDDAAAAALMNEFYAQLWDQKQPPLQALRQAQLLLVRSDPKDYPRLAARGLGAGTQDLTKVPVKSSHPAAGKGAHPALWAAFTLSGPGTAAAVGGPPAP